MYTEEEDAQNKPPQKEEDKHHDHDVVRQSSDELSVESAGITKGVEFKIKGSAQIENQKKSRYKNIDSQEIYDQESIVTISEK